MVRLRPAGLSHTVEFIDCPELAAGFCSTLHGAQVVETKAGDSRLLLSVERTSRAYRWVPSILPIPKRWQEHPPTTVMEALCELQYEYFDWYLAEHPDELCLHCAAAAIGEGLVVLPNPKRAGKSTLTVHLAAAGAKVFCDDVLPITPQGDGVALGVLPRLRLPLPVALRSDMRRSIDARRGISDRRYCYVCLEGREIAAFGERAAVRRIVLLERARDGGARLIPVGRGEMLKQVIQRNFAEAVPPRAIFGRLLSLTGQADCIRLAYSDPAEAADLLMRTMPRPARRPSS